MSDCGKQSHVSSLCCTLMVALLWSTTGSDDRSGCVGGVSEDEAGRAAPFVGDNDVYEAAATCKFDFLTYAAGSPTRCLIRSNDGTADL